MEKRKGVAGGVGREKRGREWCRGSEQEKREGRGSREDRRNKSGRGRRGREWMKGVNKGRERAGIGSMVERGERKEERRMIVCGERRGQKIKRQVR